MKNKKITALLLAMMLSLSTLAGCSSGSSSSETPMPSKQEESVSAQDETLSAEENTRAEESNLPESTAGFSLSMVAPYSGSAYTAVNNNVPYFIQDEVTTQAYESYASLDYLGRCGVAMACINQGMMPTEERGSIGQVKPTGWQTIKYDNVDGKYLYNRCHLIGHQLTGEDANKQNLITGTRYLNIEGMLPFENMVADYIKETGNHVLYRVTPIFEGNNLLASGVLMEGYSVEDGGEGISYCVYAYNVQPGIGIDYATGESWSENGSQGAASQEQTTTQAPAEAQTYIINTNNGKFHSPSCRYVSQMKNPQQVTASRDDLVNQGYSPCGVCKP